MSSIFGKNNRVYYPERDTLIKNSQDYPSSIATEIENRLEGNSGTLCRAVLVFFETKETLFEFHSQDRLQNIQGITVNILTEECSSSQRDSCITSATGEKNVTLATKAFGRGVDFTCYHPVVLANGGVHVLQTFLSENASEETHLLGRTGYQGNPGSCSRIFLDDDLKKFSITKERDIETMNRTGEKSEMLNQKRNEFSEKQYSDFGIFVTEAMGKHNEIEEFWSMIGGEGSIQDICQYLVLKNSPVTKRDLFTGPFLNRRNKLNELLT